MPCKEIEKHFNQLQRVHLTWVVINALHTHRHADTQTHRHRHTDTDTHRHTDTDTHTHTHTHTHHTHVSLDKYRTFCSVATAYSCSAI